MRHQAAARQIFRNRIRIFLKIALHASASVSSDATGHSDARCYNLRLYKCIHSDRVIVTFMPTLMIGRLSSMSLPSSSHIICVPNNILPR